MRHGHGGKVPAPTMDEFNHAVEAGHEIIACSASKYGATIVLKVAFGSGDMSTVHLRPVGRSNLSAALRVFSPADTRQRVPVVTDGPLGPTVQLGHMAA
jgi:hypothetical protein